MKRLILIVLLLCLLSFFVCACDKETPTTPTTPPNTSPDGLGEDVFTQGIPPESKDTQIVEPTPTSTEDTLIESLDMTLNADGVSAVWWWDKGKAARPLRGEYLDFLEKNSINEIYLCWPNFSKENLESFVLAAGDRGIKVSLLSGDAAWIYPENKGEDSLIEEFLEYQRTASPKSRLASLHLDVEPHQLEEFYENRDEILQYYADFVLKVSKIIKDEGERIEWDIPFWFDEFEVVNENGEKEEILELLARNSDTLCLMSYRDSAEAVLECSQKEIALGKRYDCRIVLGVETHSTEGDHVSFMEEGKHEMYRECEKIYEELSRSFEKGKYGIAIHYLDTWYKLKD